MQNLSKYQIIRYCFHRHCKDIFILLKRTDIQAAIFLLLRAINISDYILINYHRITIIRVCTLGLVFSSECSLTRLVKSEKVDFTRLNVHSEDEHKEVSGHYGQTLFSFQNYCFCVYLHIFSID